MKRRVLFILALASTGLARAAVPEPSPPAHEFIEVRISPDGRYVASVEGDTSPSGGAPVIRDLVIRSVAARTAVTVSLPCGRVRQCWPSSPAWTPDSKKLTWALREPGTHKRSIYQVSPDGTGLTRVLAFNGTLADLRYDSAGELAVLAVENATKELGAVEAGAAIVGDLAAAVPEQRIGVLEGDHLRWASPAGLFVYEYDWQPDGRGFVGTAAAGDGDKNWWVARLYAFDASSSQQRLLYSPASPQQQLAAPKVSRDGRRVAFIAGLMSDFGSTGGDIYSVALEGGAAIPVTPNLPASVTALYWSCDGRLTAVALAGAEFELIDFGHAEAATVGRILWRGQEFLDADSGDLPGACPSGLSALPHESFNRPPEIEMGKAARWSDLTHANEGRSAPVKARSISWKSDEFTVQGWLLQPEGTPANVKLPLITVVHGGPAAAVHPIFFTGRTRSLLEHGYAVFFPNPRGSFGQGDAFTRANVRDLGHGDLRDVLSGLDELERLGVADPARLAIMGHSYGGFMTMWAVTQTNRFKVAVAGAGISNWQSYYGENGIDEWMIPYFGASVYDDPAVYAKSSPINFIRQVRTPTFSYVGADDIECPAPQTLEFARALEALGVPSSVVIYPEEGHALHDPAHLADLSERILKWFDRYLKSDSSSALSEPMR